MTSKVVEVPGTLYPGSSMTGCYHARIVMHGRTSSPHNQTQPRAFSYRLSDSDMPELIHDLRDALVSVDKVSLVVSAVCLATVRVVVASDDETLGLGTVLVYNISVETPASTAGWSSSCGDERTSE